MSFVNNALDWLGEKIAKVLVHESSGYEPFTPSDPETLRRALQPGDVLLVEGNQKVAAAIKYLTQSTWSHAAIYVGDILGELDSSELDDEKESNTLIEVNLGEGCVARPLSKYRCFNTRICRPVGLTPEDRKKVVDYMVAHLGTAYDTRNILDLARYLLPTPPIPIRWRRRMIALGSGEPTRAICSTMIAQAFQQVLYPILPRVERVQPSEDNISSTYSRREILHIRHHSLFAPRDFDVSPFFQIIKPTIEFGFDYKQLEWSSGGPGEGPRGHAGLGRKVFERAEPEEPKVDGGEKGSVDDVAKKASENDPDLNSARNSPGSDTSKHDEPV